MNRTSALAGLLIFITYLTVALIQPRDCFWVTDGGNKFIQMQGFLRNGFSSLSIDYPAKDIDPDYHFFPYSSHHFFNVNGRVLSFYPPWYSLFCAPFYSVFGWFALDLLSVIAALGSLAAAFLLIKKTGIPLNPAHQLLIAAFATPMFFYGVVFWEHAPSLFLAMFGLYLVTVKRKIWTARFAAGACVGLATVFREEGYLLFTGMLAAYLSIKEGRRFVTSVVPGWLAVMAPLWAVQHAVFGNFMGIHAKVFGFSGALSNVFSFRGIIDKLVETSIFLFQAHFDLAVNLLLITPLACGTAAGFLLKRPAEHPGLISLLIGAQCTSALALLITMLSQEDVIYNTGATQGLFSTVPFLVLVAIFFRSSLVSPIAWKKALAVFSLFYLSAACLLLNASDIGVIWGPRFFLFLFPAFVPLAWSASEEILSASKGTRYRRLLLSLLFLLFALSACIQSVGIRTLFIKKEASSRIVNALKNTREEIIISDIPWLAEEAAAVYYSRKIMWVRSPGDFAELFRLFNAGRVQSAAFVLSEKFSRSNWELAQNIFEKSTGRFNLRFKHAGMLNCTVAPVMQSQR